MITLFPSQRGFKATAFGVWSILQATFGETSPGTWIGWEVVPEQVWDSTDTGVISERDDVETAGDCPAVETVGESSDVYEGAREGRRGDGTGNGDGTEEENDD